LSNNTISGKLNENSYQQWMHTLLYIEEMALRSHREIQSHDFLFFS
jgi:hypothetical protein